MNDTAKSIYPYTVQLPYLNMALQELQETFELNEVPVTDTFTADPITIPAGTTSLGFSDNAPSLPDDLIEPQIVWESLFDQDQYTMMQKVDFLPRYLEGVEINQLLQYVWQAQEIRFLAANTDIDLKLDYIRNLFVEFTETDGTDEVNVINAGTYLEYKTAALLARFIAENPTRADSLDALALNRLETVLGIGSKGRQAIITRRRPFRAGYKHRSYM